MTPDQAQIALQELAARMGLRDPIEARHTEGQVDRLVSRLFAQQRAARDDPSRRKALLCGRRGGKTEDLVTETLEALLKNPGGAGMYIGITRASAKDIAWHLFKQVNLEFNLKGRINETELTIWFPNRSHLKLYGADKPKEIEKRRGQRTAVAVIDEAASYGGFLKDLILDVLEPSTMDLNGKLIMAGTPANHCQGYFFDATTGALPGWTCHKWTALDNPYIADAAKFMREIKEANGWDDNNPVYRREYMGEWVRTIEAQVYHYNEELNAYKGEAPDADREYSVLGVDLGFSDDTSFTVGQFGENAQQLYIPLSYKRPEMIPSEIAQEIRKLTANWGSFNRIVVDIGGGLGQGYLEEFRKRYGLPVQPAKKSNKNDYIELMNDDFRTGKILVNTEGAAPLVEEYNMLQWDQAMKIEDSRFANHCADSALYMWREALHWRNERKALTVPLTQAQALKEKEDDFEKEALQEFQVADREEWWD